jgi:hypothetical protein
MPGSTSPLPKQHYATASSGPERVGGLVKQASSRTCLSCIPTPGDKTWNANSGFGYISLPRLVTIRNGGRWESIFDCEILAVYLWAVLHDRPTSWACQRCNWPEGLWPRRRLPSQSTMSRRLRTTEVQRLLDLMEESLKQLQGQSWVNVVDGKPLVIGAHSKDPDAQWGWASRSYAKGYKLHAVYGCNPLPLRWEVTPLNVGEAAVAARLIPTLNGGGYLLGDKQYDSNPLHDVARRVGYQLVAERKRPRAGLGHRQHSAGRLRSMDLLQKDFGKALYRRRDDIERQFGWLTSHAAGLSPLPSWVRRLDRVTRWVQAKLVVHAIYVALWHPPPTLAVA